MENGMEIGMENGMEIGMENGMEIGMENGMEIGMENGMEIGMENGMEIGMENGMENDEELVMQNLRRELHSSITVCCFRKLKSCCYVIAIPSGWHPCPNPNCNARFWSKKKIALCISFPVPAYCITHAQPKRESNLGAEDW